MDIETRKKKILAITGASGFVGRHLIASLQKQYGFRIRALVHNTYDGLENKTLKIFRGDMLDKESLVVFLEHGCTVINLAFLREGSSEQNIQAVHNLLEACNQVGVSRLIHLSTATVVGKTSEKVVDENTECFPVYGYEALKLELEETVLASSRKFEVVVLRPTAVFGPGGQNLLSLADGIQQRRVLCSYFKLCLYNYRKMNLVAIDNVVAAIEFFVNSGQSLNGEIFLVSDDDVPENNYRDIDSFLRMKFRIKQGNIPIIPLPRCLLSFLLIITGRSNTDSIRIYSGEKLLEFGFEKKVSFETSLSAFAEWYRAVDRRI